MVFARTIVDSSGSFTGRREVRPNITAYRLVGDPAVAVLFRVLIEGKSQLSEIHERFDHVLECIDADRRTRWEHLDV